MKRLIIGLWSIIAIRVMARLQRKPAWRLSGKETGIFPVLT
jgi:hypothetical protein